MKSNWKQVVAAFLIGCLLGVAAGSRSQRWAFHRFWQHGPDTQRALKKISRELDLDAKQQAAVRAILDKQHDKIMELHKDMSAKFNEVRMSMRREIKPLLNPDQQKKLEAMAVRWDAHRKRPEDDLESSPGK